MRVGVLVCVEVEIPRRKRLKDMRSSRKVR
jgi:hypothetical protein